MLRGNFLFIFFLIFLIIFLVEVSSRVSTLKMWNDNLFYPTKQYFKSTQGGELAHWYASHFMYSRPRFKSRREFFFCFGCNVYVQSNITMVFIWICLIVQYTELSNTLKTFSIYSNSIINLSLPFPAMITLIVVNFFQILTASNCDQTNCN